MFKAIRIIAVGLLCAVPTINADEKPVEKNDLTLANLTATDVARIAAEGLIGYETSKFLFKDEAKKVQILFALGGMYKGYKHVEYQKNGEKFPAIPNIILNALGTLGLAQLGGDCGQEYGRYFYPNNKGAMVGSTINGVLIGYITGLLLMAYSAYKFDPKTDRVL